VNCIARDDANQAVALVDQHLRELDCHLTLECLAALKGLAHLIGLS
jgi:hypothetical protein